MEEPTINELRKASGLFKYWDALEKSYKELLLTIKEVFDKWIEENSTNR